MSCLSVSCLSVSCRVTLYTRVQETSLYWIFQKHGLESGGDRKRYEHWCRWSCNCGKTSVSLERMRCPRDSLTGLQRYTELSSIRDMGSGEPANRIASHIFRKVCKLSWTSYCPENRQISGQNLSWQPLFLVKCMWFQLDAQICFCTSGPSKSKNINYWKIHS